VYIEVIDTNDNQPLFAATHYEGSFAESSPVGTTLLKVTATDADDNRLVYTLPRCCNSASTQELFAVNAETGKLSIIKLESTELMKWVQRSFQFVPVHLLLHSLGYF
jgi:hypothetical protein